MICDKVIVRSRSMKRVLALSALIATGSAILGSNLEAASDPRATQLTYESWMKNCIGATCFVGTGAHGACNPSGGGLAIVTDEKGVSLSINLGTKRTLEGAISAQIDQGETILIPHPQCEGRVCYGRTPIDSGLSDRLRKSKTIVVHTTDSAHQEISVAFSLAGFAEAYDGPAAPEPKVFEETNEKLKEELARRAEEQKKLECKE
jgi:invasion protein IalB